MEYLVYILASALAGIGTGLAGLSAATVMVPLIIVLCPSFSGQTGVYQATAIALASDILGSAVTTSIYIRHGNIDFKRSRIMMTLIPLLCVVGSWAAYRAGNVVLGGFTLFLTFCIGIRFLLFPDTSRKESVSKDKKLGVLEIGMSIFWGLSIGFGTGFVGTGGGMMMLVVFTAFLGMGLKPAVGTSTFIMTFTALIASVSHMLIEPAIILERWDALLVCVVTATLFSLLSARFANRVSNKTVGLVTGLVLTILGLAMILINYRESIAKNPLLLETLRCCGLLILFFIVGLIVIAIARAVIKIPSYIFRKLLHTIAYGSTVFVISMTDQWSCAALSCILVALLVYPLIRAAENLSWFDGFLVQKRKGEIRLSLALFFGISAAVIAITWGCLGKPYVAVASILMWGQGDAAAAIVGKTWGRHPLPLQAVKGKKTWEGSIAMVAVCCLCCFLTMLFMTAFPIWRIVLASILCAFLSTLTEAVSGSEWDTVTVPAAAMLSLILFTL